VTEQEARRNNPDPDAARRRLIAFVGRAFVGLPIVLALVQGPLQPIAIAQHAMAGAAALIAALMLVEGRLRTRLRSNRRRAVEGTRPARTAEWVVVMLAIAAAGILLHPSMLILLAIGGVFLVFCAMPAGAEIGERIAIATRHASRAQAATLSTLIIGVAMSALAVSAVALAATVMPPAIELLQTGGGGPAAGPTTTSTQTPAPPSPSTEAPPSAPPGPIEKSVPAWNGECPRKPENTAPFQYEIEIKELYSGEEPDPQSPVRYPLPPSTGGAPGRKVAGCTKEFNETMSGVGPFVWAWGQNPDTGRALSIAVDSEQYGPALFLAPATGPVRQLIRRFKAVGGIRRFTAGTGDFYPVRTPIGTFILIRRETGSEDDEYQELGPVVAQAWVQAMKKARAFLWPARVTGGAYDFDADETTLRVAYSLPYKSPNTVEPELGEHELKEDANRARTPGS
jgi:hypothetical protein